MTGSGEHKRDPKHNQNIGQQKEEKFFQGQNTAEENADRLFRTNCPGTGLDGDRVGRRQIQGREGDCDGDQPPIVPQDISADRQLENNGDERPA